MCICLSDGQQVGFLQALFVNSRPEVSSLLHESVRDELTKKNLMIIGYSIEEKYRGKKYCQNAVMGMLRVIRENKWADAVIATIHPENAASIAVITRCGFVNVCDQPNKNNEILFFREIN